MAIIINEPKDKIKGFLKRLYSYFYKSKTVRRKKDGWETEYVKDDLVGSKLDFDLISSETGKSYASSGDKFNILIEKKLKEDSVKNLFLDNENLKDSYNFSDEMTFDEFKLKLEEYAKNSPYPNPDD